MCRGLAHTQCVRTRLPAVGLALALLLVGLPAPAAAREVVAAAAAPAAAIPAGDRLLVRFKPEASDAARAAALRRVGGTVTGGIAELGVTRVALVLPSSPGLAVALALPAAPGLAVALLGADPAVDWAEPDRRMGLDLTPNDPYFLTDPYTGLGLWGLRKIQADKAWDLVRGSPQIIVAVVDTGVDPAHPDLASALLPGVAFNSSPSAGCGQPTRDDNGHGTHVAGIIGASGNDGVGVIGTAFGVRILPLKALDCEGTGVVGDIAQAIVYALNNGARVINVSLGAPTDSQTLRAAVQAAASRNVLIVAAAGNCGIGGAACDTTNETSYPAAYPEVLAVAATDVDDTRATFSTAALYVGIAAPGRSIVSTAPNCWLAPAVPRWSAVDLRRPMSCADVRFGSRDSTSAAVPATKGVACEVPLITA